MDPSLCVFALNLFGSFNLGSQILFRQPRSNAVISSVKPKENPLDVDYYMTL